MNTRTIQKTGGSSFTVTIPKDWMESRKLSEKDSLEFYFSQAGPLCFKPTSTKNVTKSFLDIDYLSQEHISREIFGMFVLGTDEITIRARNITHDQRSFIRKLSYKLIGFEVFESTTHTMTLRNVSSSTIPTLEYMQKIYTIMLSMYTDAIEAVEHKNIQLARDIIERDVEIDRIHMLISRQLHILLRDIIPQSNDSESLINMQYNNLVTIRLERIADLILRIAYSLLLIQPSESLKLTPTEHHALTSTTDYLMLLKDIIFQTNKRTSHKLLDMYDTYQKTEILKKYIHNKPYCNIRIAECIERIRGYSANIAEETIDYSYGKTLKDQHT